MATGIRSQCCDGEDETFPFNCIHEASNTPPAETISSLNEAKHDKTTMTGQARSIVSVQPFKSQDEFLFAMQEDVTEWLNSLFGLDIKSPDLMVHLETGVLLCRLANTLDGLMVDDEKRRGSELAAGRAAPKSRDVRELTSAIRRSVATRPLATISGNDGAIVYRESATRGSFQSRDNISNFLNWCRNRLKLADTVLFETEDLVAGRNERNVILCLLEVARRGSKHGMIVPELIEMESEIDAELGKESTAEKEEAERLHGREETDDQENGTEIEQVSSTSGHGVLCEVKRSTLEEDNEAMVSAFMGGSGQLELTIPAPRASFYMRLRDLVRMRNRRPETHRGLKETIDVDTLTLDELVHRFLGNCRCQQQYPMVKISDGKYRVGENLMLTFVRLLRDHVMLRIGGGWETLADYLRRHDPCRAAEQQHELRRTQAIEKKTMPTDDEATNANSKSAPEQDKISQEKEEKKPTDDKNVSKTEENMTADDKNMSKTEENTPEEDKTMPENDEKHGGTDTAKQRELNLSEANESISS